MADQRPVSPDNDHSASPIAMRNYLGIAFQIIGLTLLPLLILWQLNFGFQLLWMPSLTLVGVVIFWIGCQLREKA